MKRTIQEILDAYDSIEDGELIAVTYDELLMLKGALQKRADSKKLVLEGSRMTIEKDQEDSGIRAPGR